MKTKTVTIFRAFVSDSAQIPREALIERMTREGLDVSCVPRSRNDKDALRIGVGNLFKSAHRFKSDKGEPCRLLVSEAKLADADVRLDVHARNDGKTVTYSERLVSFILVNGGIRLSLSDDNPWPTLQKCGISALDPQRLMDDGKNLLFSRDLRRVIDSLIPSMDIKAWRGVYFAFGDDAREKVDATSRVLGDLPEGVAQISALTLENTPQNLKQIAKDLEVSFAERFGVLLDKLKNDPGVNVRAVRLEYDHLLVSHAEMEKQLDEAVDIYDAAEECETWLLMAEADSK